MHLNISSAKWRSICPVGVGVGVGGGGGGVGGGGGGGGWGGGGGGGDLFTHWGGVTHLIEAEWRIYASVK